MTFMSWRKDFEVGVAQIDAEHRHLFDLINAFHETYAGGDTRTEIAQVLNRLVAYAEEHFQHEEQLMRDSAYPQLDMHMELHSELVLSIFAINEKLAADPVKASTDIVHFLKSWLLQHILQRDMDIAEFLKRKSLQASAANATEATEQKTEKLSDSAQKPESGKAQ